MISKTNYNAIDLVKFLSAILLVCAHTASERVSLPPLLDLCCSLYIITVPFFFIASAFLFFKKLNTQTQEEQKQSYKRYSSRIWIMYLVWSLIYFCFILIGWVKDGCSISAVVQYFHHAVVFTTYPTIWFLPALWLGVSLVYVCRYRWNWSNKTILLVSLLFYLVGSICYSYHSLTSITETIHQVYTSVFVTWRNGFFNAFVYAALGYIIAVGGNADIIKSSIGSVVFGIAFMAEALLMKKIVPSSDANFIFMLVPFSYFFFSLLCQIKLPDSKAYLPMRKMSMLIFVSQRLFLTALPSVVSVGFFSGPWNITNNGILALGILVAEVCLFSYLLMFLSKKYRFLRILM